MYYGLKNPKRKQQFIIMLNQQIKVYKNLLQGLDMCKPSILSFDGKVVNAKLITAIMTAENPNKLSFNITTKAGFQGMVISISDFNNRTYSSVDNLYTHHLTSYTCVFPISTTKPDEYSQDRLNAEETLKQIEVKKEYLLKKIEECLTAIQMYDKEIEAWEELKKHVEAYEKNFSSRLRGKITLGSR